MQGQVFDGLGFAPGIGAAQFGRIQARHGALHRALAPVEPEFTTRLEFRDFPRRNQRGRQPLGPVALRQAHIGLGRTVTPAAGLDLGRDTQRDRLAIGQGQARIEALVRGADIQGQPYIRQGQRGLFVGFQGHLAVEHRQSRHMLQLGEQLLRVQRLVILHWQTLEGPVAVLILTQAQLQAIKLHAGNTDIAVQQAGQHIGHHLHFVQAQGAVTLADHHIVGLQYRRHAAPASFKAANGQWHAQGVSGFVLNLYAVFGNQRGQFTADADVQRRQHQNQSARAQPPTGQRGKKACQTLHVRWPLQ